MMPLPQGLEISLLAEGVETEQPWLPLRLAECARFQSYLFGRPAAGDPQLLLQERWRPRPQPQPARVRS